jgi:hypothetical protein
MKNVVLVIENYFSGQSPIVAFAFLVESFPANGYSILGEWLQCGLRKNLLAWVVRNLRQC